MPIQCDAIFLPSDVARNIPYAILIGSMNAELRSLHLYVDEVASYEEVPESLVVRWASILIEHELISMREDGCGKLRLALAPKGRDAMVSYLASLADDDNGR